MQFIVYSSAGCVKCRMTANRLEKAGHTVDVRKADESDDVRAEALALSGGRLELPIVRSETGEVWTDFRADKLSEYGA